MTRRSLRIAFIGTRGVPARYGGFETLAAELSGRLSQRGHHVTVYSRRGRVDEGSPPPGVEQRFVPMIATKHLETITHTTFSVLDAITRRFDVVLMVNAANAILAGVPRLYGVPVALNVDGIERKRAKWGLAGRGWYRLGERLATILPNEIISDATIIEEYYAASYGAKSTMIPYGTTILDRDPPPDLSAYGVEPESYVLYVSRLEPENNADMVIEAYRSVEGNVPLLIVGDAPYANEYKALVTRLAAGDPRVRLMGAVYGQGYRDLQRGALAYVQATEVGGTHPALVEAMGAGNIVLARGTPENREVTGGTAILFDDVTSLTAGLQSVIDPERRHSLAQMGARARRRALETYSWDAVTDAYEHLLLNLAETHFRTKRQR